MKPFKTLPELALVKIFLHLPGGALHKCRQVCKEWNDVILNSIWSSVHVRKQLEKRLETNWGSTTQDGPRLEPKYTLQSKFIETNFHGPCVLVAASENFLVVGPDNTNMNESGDENESSDEEEAAVTDVLET